MASGRPGWVQSEAISDREDEGRPVVHRPSETDRRRRAFAAGPDTSICLHLIHIIREWPRTERRTGGAYVVAQKIIAI